MGDDDDIEIIDTENYTGQKNITFSHQDLVMRSLKRVLEIGGHELIEGINISTSSNKDKADKLTFKEDTRKSFINAIRICKSVMNRDFDDEAKKIINKCIEEIKQKENELLTQQFEDWKNLNPKQRQNVGSIQPKLFNKTLHYYYDYIDFQIEKSWEIFEELNNLTARLGDYEIEDFEA